MEEDDEKWVGDEKWRCIYIRVCCVYVRVNKVDLDRWFAHA